MALAIIHSRANIGLYAPSVAVETHISNGIPKLSIVGLPETAVKESKDRVRSAILNAHFEFPPKRITINLAPADLPKEGGRFDLPIALGVLAATGQIPQNTLDQYEFAGELALSGELRPIQSILPFALATQKAQRHLIIPYENAMEASLVKHITLYPAQHLLDVCAHLTGQKLLDPFVPNHFDFTEHCYPDLYDVKGQNHAKRALEVAAAGGHSLLLIGPPGTGKSMLANRLPGLLPQLTEEEAVEIVAIASLVSKKFEPNTCYKRPFRAPHHTASNIALVGGGNPPRPGEITLSHQGILFLDELPEFNRHALESLREPLESGNITISRATQQMDFPARFQLVATMNPCPCGYAGDNNHRCHCSPEKIQRYRGRVSGPLLDRIDIHIEVPRITDEIITTNEISEKSAQIRIRVERARTKQIQRTGIINARLSENQIESVCSLIDEDRSFLSQAIKQLHLSTRAFHRILRLARTIADLADDEVIKTAYLMEALSYRRLSK